MRADVIRITIAICCCYALRTTIRLADWHDNGTIWRAAVQSDPDDPWAANNAAVWAGDDRALRTVVWRPVPPWLPPLDRTVYLMDHFTLADALYWHGYRQCSARVIEHAIKVSPWIQRVD